MMRLSTTYLLATIFFSFLGTSLGAQPHDTLMIDFGNNSSPFPWNNISHPANGSISDLYKSDGIRSGYGIAVVDAFNNINTNGTTEPAASIGFPATATGDSFFGNIETFGGQSQPTGAIELNQLNPTKAYTITLFASREATDNRETQYVVTGQTSDTVFLQVASNQDMVATVTLQPDTDGRIRVVASPGPNNNNTYHFYYLGAMKVHYTHEEPDTMSLTLLRPNGGEFWQVGQTPKIQWESNGYGLIDIEYSIDDGQTWMLVETVFATIGQYEWTVPDAVSTQCLIRLGNPNPLDESDAVFEISSSDMQCPIVVLGSSTAAGTGPTHPDSSWVSLFQSHLGFDTRYRIINLAKGGYTTYHILPTGTPVLPWIGIAPDEDRNITEALTYQPYAIIINMPSNDAANGFPAVSQMNNFETIRQEAVLNDVLTWVCTPQPRNFSEPSKVDIQWALLDSVLNRYDDRAIDFWHGIADSVGYILPEYDSGDGVHLNNAGHSLLAERVIDSGIDTFSCLSPNPTFELERGEISPIQVFPNPTLGEVNIAFNALGEGQMKLKIVDVFGRLIDQRHFSISRSGRHDFKYNPANTKAEVGPVVFCFIDIITTRGTTRQVTKLMIFR